MHLCRPTSSLSPKLVNLLKIHISEYLIWSCEIYTLYPSSNIYLLLNVHLSQILFRPTSSGESLAEMSEHLIPSREIHHHIILSFMYLSVYWFRLWQIVWCSHKIRKIHISNNCWSFSESTRISVDNASVLGHTIEDRLPGNKENSASGNNIQLQKRMEFTNSNTNTN